MTSQPPLTHHEIVGLVEPFTRLGRRIDLDASNRLERRLLFRPVEHMSEIPELQGLRESLRLENPYSGTYRLTRVLTLRSGLQATLQADGPHPSELLALVMSIPPQRQFQAGMGFMIACSHQIAPPGTATKGAIEIPLLLTQGVVQLKGLTFTLKMPTVKNFPAEIELDDKDGDLIKLPEDLIAVLGWDWAPLKRNKDGWSSKLRLRGKGADRTRRAEAKLEKAAWHLAQTLAELPRRFHERFVWARWWAVVRRTIPILTCIGVVAVGMVIPVNVFEDHPFVRMLLMNAPLLVIGFSFALQELSRIEIPPLPRPSKASAWRQSEPQVSALPLSSSDGRFDAESAV